MCVLAAIAFVVALTSNPALVCFAATEINATFDNGTAMIPPPPLLEGGAVAMTCAGEQLVVGVPSGDGFVQVARLDFATNAYASTQLLTPPVLNASGMFGEAVAVDCTAGSLAVGEPLANTSGVLHLYARSPDITDVSSLYAPIDSIASPAAPEPELFGQALAFACHRALLAVGAPVGDSGGGRVYLFERNATGVWALLETIERPTDNVTSATAEFGSSVALSCDGLRLAAGAPLDDDGGSAALYRRDNLSTPFVLVQVLRQEQDDAHFGSVVALSQRGALVTVGAPRFDALNATLVDAGRIFQFAHDSPVDRFVAAAEPFEGTVAGARFGASLSVSGDGHALVVGSSSGGIEPGSAMHFELVVDDDHHHRYQSIDDTFANARDSGSLGQAVATSFGGHEFASTSTSNTTAEANSTRIGVVDCWQRRGSSCPSY